MGHAELQPEDIDESISALRGALKRTWNDFCATTSIHGLKYTKDKETNKYIRFIWYIITLILLICAIIMVFTFYVDYRSNPTRMNVENDHAPISSMLFPSTVICPEVLYNVEKSKKYLETLILPESISLTKISDLLGINYGFMYDDEHFDIKDLELMDELLYLNNLNILDFMMNLSWNCNDLIFKCRYNARIVPCETLFDTVRTFNGFCCGFNLNQTINNNFTNQVAYAGFRGGLSLILYYNDSMYDRVKSYSHGFKVMIQETNAFPSAHSPNKFIPLNAEVSIAVRPTETFSSQAVKDLTFEERQCAYPYERHLAYFPAFVALNCDLNCRVSKMVEFCGCYTYFFYTNRTNERICTYKDITCLVDNFANIITRLKKDQCVCVQSCENFEYRIAATSMPTNLEIPTVDSFYKDLKKDYSILHIYMNSQVYRRIRHDLLSNMVTLVSNLGSAFSLFVGMSMVSAVEIVYYFTVILRKYHRQECNARQKLFVKKQTVAKEKKEEDNTN